MYFEDYLRLYCLYSAAAAVAAGDLCESKQLIIIQYNQNQHKEFSFQFLSPADHDTTPQNLKDFTCCWKSSPRITVSNQSHGDLGVLPLLSQLCQSKYTERKKRPFLTLSILDKDPVGEVKTHFCLWKGRPGLPIDTKASGTLYSHALLFQKCVTHMHTHAGQLLYSVKHIPIMWGEKSLL